MMDTHVSRLEFKGNRRTKYPDFSVEDVNTSKGLNGRAIANILLFNTL